MRRIMSLLTAAVIGAFAYAASGEVTPARDRAVAGGWSPASTNDAGVIAAAAHAVSARSAAAGENVKLSAVLESRRQVVAGMNYRLLLAVVRDGAQERATAVVWAKLDGSHKLTEWIWSADRHSSTNDLPARNAPQ